MIDIGANLAHESFSADLDAVLERAWAAGLDQVLITGSCRSSNVRALSLCDRAPGRLFATAGVHPHHASEWEDRVDGDLIRRLAADARLVSLGECGLDYHRDLSPRQTQRRVFAAQLTLAAELGKPVFLHQRSAHDDFLPILREFRPHLVNACVHCFTDTQAAMEAYIALDCYVGITGWVCDARRGQPLRDVVPHIPIDRLLIETDAPYLLPHTLPRGQRPGQRQSDKPGIDGRRNEPGYLPWVARSLAELRGVSEAELVAQTVANTRRCFALAATAAPADSASSPGRSGSSTRR